MEIKQNMNQDQTVVRITPQNTANKKTRMIIVVLILLLVVLLGVLGYFLFVGKKQEVSPVEGNRKELQEVIEAVGKLILLPEGEEPTLATVSDPSKLKDQAFFKNAELGDKVLIYSQAKKAILYSPTKNKIIEIAPINLNPQAEKTTQLPLDQGGSNSVSNGANNTPKANTNR